MATATKKPQPKEYTAESGIGQRLAEVQRLALEAERVKEALDAEKAYLLAHAVRQGLSGVRCGATTLSVREDATYTYSAAVQKAETALKLRKEKERATGVATKATKDTAVVTVSGKAALALGLVAALNALAERTPPAARQEVPA
jgi:hypothetical protein